MLRNHTLAGASVLAILLAAIAAGSGSAATSNVVVTMDVTSQTTLITTGCLPGVADRTDFGIVQPGTGAVTGNPCAVTFGSSNDTSTLRTYQPDGRGTAMAQPPTSMTGGGSDYRMLDVEMATPAIGWAVGDGAAGTHRMHKTIDGGATWTSLTDADFSTTLEGVSAVSSTVAWAVGSNVNLVVRTTDGVNWSATNTPGATAQLNDIAAFSATHAWALGSETVLGVAQPRVWRTTDGGTTWALVHAPAVSSNIENGAAFSTTSAWIAQANGQLYRAVDGVTFNPVGPASGSFSAFAALDDNRVAATTGNGSLVVTTNGGTNWFTRPSTERGLLTGLAWSPNGDVWSSGMHGALQKTPDAGVTWTVVPNPHEGSLLRAISSPANDQLVVVTAARTGLATVDGGSTWSLWRASAAANWKAVDGIDSSRLWRVGGSGVVSTSTNGGTSWAAQTSPTTNALYDVVTIDSNTGVAVGAGGVIIRTTNGGTNWTTVSSGTTARLRSAGVAPDGRTLLAGGDGGALLVSSNGGASWTSIASGSTTPITAVALWDAMSWIFGTSDHVVRTTTNAGTAWTTRVSGANEGIASAVAVPGTTTAHLLYDDNIATTTDGGVGWSTQELSGSGQLLDMDFDGAEVLWAGGLYSRLMRGDAGGTNWRTMSGPNTSTNIQGVTALGTDAAVTASDGNRGDYTTQSVTIPDYSGTQWGTSSGAFGVCLVSIPGAANTWPTTGSCPQTDGTNWRALPLNSGVPAAKVGDLTAPGTTTASFRFGVYVPAAQTPGSYRVPMAFEVVAPGA
jgi:photosystem II stability/assembly factor-like uncharacterized protein